MFEIFYLKNAGEKAHHVLVIKLATKKQRWTRQKEKHPWIYESYNLVGKMTHKKNKQMNYL